MLFRSADNLPTLVVGDFNDWRDTLAAASLGANGFMQVTSPAGKFRSFPAWLAVGSLDKAFVRGPIAVRQARIVKTSLSKTASDHLPLVVDFHLGRMPAH
jgi:endonuclease/exonuclease/phosphatase family metal-dependent hydrolase